MARDARWFHVVMVALFLGGLLLGGCETTENKRRAELERVAKDWSMVIRASQVIPVYPMTEDLQVGDVFLVQRPVDEQHKAYDKKGFLALENHIGRLRPGAYSEFYRSSFFKNDEEARSTLPRDWLTPGDPVSFGRAPTAAFPAYSFAVSTGSGFSAALPIQGVPVGLSLLNSGAAKGSVTLKDAKTYGLDILSLLPDVQRWEAANREILAMYAPEAGSGGESRQNYVRVIHRVYLVGKVNVSMQSSSAFSGGGSVGVPKPVELPLLNTPATTDAEGTATTAAESYTKGLNALNTAMEVRDAAGNILPGATLKVVAASANSVSIDETFKRPVVIGYLGFDMAILPGGLLGPPMATHAILEGYGKPNTTDRAPQLAAAHTAHAVATYRLLSAMAGDANDRNSAQARRLTGEIDGLAAAAIPSVYPVTIWSRRPEGGIVSQIASGTALPQSGGAYRALVSYRGQLHASAASLQSAAGKAGWTAEREAELARTREEIDRVEMVFANIGRRLAAGAGLIQN